jgi:tRNA isopentenyl-2-thiomethyl-A-37 hydroxylase MiaE
MVGVKKKSKEKGQNTRDLYTYIAIPKWQFRAGEFIIKKEYAEKYGINDFNNLVKNLLGEFIAHYERCHTFIKARDWAVEHIKDNRFGKTSYDRGEKNKVERLMENVDKLREEETLNM